MKHGDGKYYKASDLLKRVKIKFLNGGGIETSMKVYSYEKEDMIIHMKELGIKTLN